MNMIVNMTHIQMKFRGFSQKIEIEKFAMREILTSTE